MASDLTARDKAQAGLWMIRQAILQFLRDHGPKQPSEVREALGLHAGEGEPGTALAIMTVMVALGELDKGGGSHPTYSVKRSATGF
jgi:hypothetical protein